MQITPFTIYDTQRTAGLGFKANENNPYKEKTDKVFNEIYFNAEQDGEYTALGMRLHVKGKEAALAKPKQSLASLIREMGKEGMSIEQIADVIDYEEKTTKE